MNLTSMDDADLLRLAYKKALDSPDPSTQNGAFIATRGGSPFYTTLSCNTLPEGVADLPERWERPAKYAWVEHAERAAIYSASRQGFATRHRILVCAWAACRDCARAIVGAGIETLVTHRREPTTHWSDSISEAMVILGEAGVEVRWYEGKLGCDPIRYNGNLWFP